MSAFGMPGRKNGAGSGNRLDAANELHFTDGEVIILDVYQEESGFYKAPRH